MRRSGHFILMLITLAFTAFGLSLSGEDRAAQDSWRQIGPVGGSVYAVGVNPRNARHVYITTEYSRAGVFRSLNAGKKWKKIMMTEGSLGAVAVDPKNKKVVYVLGDEKIFKTKNMGKKWEEFQFAASDSSNHDSGYALFRFRKDIVIHPNNSSIIYVAGRIEYYDPMEEVMAVGKSIDGGKTWTFTDLTPGSKRGSTEALAINPNNPDEIYAAGYYITRQNGLTGVFKSINGGASWQQIAMNTLQGAETVALDPNNPAHLLLGGNMGFFRSINGGKNWQQCNTACGGAVDFVFDPVNPLTIYGAGYQGYINKSIDGGATWTRIPLADMLGFCTGIDGGGKKPVYVATTAGFYVSKDKGASFQASHNGFFAAETQAVGVAPSNPRIVYAGAEATGFFKSKNIGKKWIKLNKECSEVRKILIHPNNPDKILCITLGYSYQQLIRSSDGGKTIEKLLKKNLRDIDMDWNNPDTIYSAGSSKMEWDDDPLIRVFKSTNGGKDWKTIVPIHSRGVLKCIAFDRLNPNVVYTGGYIRPKLGSYDRAAIIYKSVNGGQKWTEIYRGSYDIEEIVIDPVTPSTIYAGSGNFLYKSFDSGATWQQLASDFPASSLLIHPVKPRILIAAGYSGVFYSTDAGLNWSSSTKGLDLQQVNSIDWNWKNKSLFAATGNGGIYVNNGLLKLLK